jgi:hypothetical protein
VEESNSGSALTSRRYLTSGGEAGVDGVKFRIGLELRGGISHRAADPKRWDPKGNNRDLAKAKSDFRVKRVEDYERDDGYGPDA